MRRVALAVVFTTVFATQAARANDVAASDDKAKDAITSESPVKDSADSGKGSATTATALKLQPSLATVTGAAVLRSLHVGLALAQAYDVYSTSKALDRGAVEVNPLLRNMVANRGAFIGLKIAMTAGPIYEAEKLWRSHHRIGAIALMAASNGLMMAVAAHNANIMNNAVTVR